MKKKDKEVFKREKPHCNIGTIGHVDHGKTTLTSAITKVLYKEDKKNKYILYENIDKQKEERVRGITIQATHLEYWTKKKHYSHIDCPGHQDYIKNMIIGATQMDGAILVVSVVEGPQEQTREHVILAKEVGIKKIVIYLNKMDVVKDKEIIEMVKFEIEELLSFYGFENCPIIEGSARIALLEKNNSDLGENSVKKLIDVIDNYIEIPERDLKSSFLLPIEDIILIKGRGIVVTGRVERGILKIGEELEVIGKEKKKVICIGLEMFQKVLDKAEAGENVGVLLKNLTNDDKKRGLVKRGALLVKLNSVDLWLIFRVKVVILLTEEGGRRTPFRSKYKPQFFFRMLNITGTIILDDDEDMVKPGDLKEFNVKLKEKVPLEKGLRFTMREGRITVGAGIIIKLIN